MPRCARNDTSRHGFSLIEILITTSIIVILTYASIPSVLDLFLRNKFNNIYYKFQTAIDFARSEAIRRDKNVFICAGDYDKYSLIHSCKTTTNHFTDWSDGVIVFIDNTSSGSYHTGADLKALQFDNNTPLKVPLLSTINYIYFNSNGEMMTNVESYAGITIHAEQILAKKHKHCLISINHQGALSKSC